MFARPPTIDDYLDAFNKGLGMALKGQPMPACRMPFYDALDKIAYYVFDNVDAVDEARIAEMTTAAYEALGEAIRCHD